MKKTKCISCEEFKEDIILSDNAEPVCETCYYETEPQATVVWSDNRGEYPLEMEHTGSKDVITEYHNATPFIIKWKSTDSWRGHFETIKSGDWVKVHDDCVCKGFLPDFQSFLVGL